MFPRWAGGKEGGREGGATYACEPGRSGLVAGVDELPAFAPFVVRPFLDGGGRLSREGGGARGWCVQVDSVETRGTVYLYPRQCRVIE
jgi:hypothetical protein